MALATKSLTAGISFRTSWDMSRSAPMWRSAPTRRSIAAPIRPTVIGDGTKIDNLVMIAHNCRIGRHNMICSQVGIAGSTTTGDYVVMAGQVGVRDHVHIGTGAMLGAMAGVANDVPDGAHMLGAPGCSRARAKADVRHDGQAAGDAQAAQRAAAANGERCWGPKAAAAVPQRDSGECGT